MQKGVSMLYNVLGLKKNMSFPGKDGAMVNGCKLYVSCPDEKVDGLMADSFFISASAPIYDKVNSLKPDQCIDIYFSRYGRIDGICVAQ